jgi:hypothetical protein
MGRRGKVSADTHECRQVVVVSDLHCGCRIGLCPPDGVPLDDGGHYWPGRIQEKMWEMWHEFWTEWVPLVTKGEPFDLVVNGDALDGVHHGAVTQVSQNMEDQLRIAEECLRPVVERAVRYFHVRGTEAHVGKSAQYEEALAKRLGAVPNEDGQHARWELWLRVGGHLVHLLHHIGTSGSAAYEATAVHKEMAESFVEAGRFGKEPPQVVVRSHRHRYLKDEIYGEKGYYISVVTPGWQAKTPFTWKIAGARLSQPQFGGLLVRKGDDELYTRSRVWCLERSREG